MPAIFKPYLSNRPPRLLYTPPPAPPAPSSTALLADLAAARAGNASPAAITALGSAGLLGSVGYTAGAEGLLGTLSLNPYTAIPAAALLVAELTGLIPSFAGKPKLLDSAQAAQRLLGSPFLPLQRLGERIAIFVKNGVPLSTGDPAYQQEIRTAVQGTVRSILAQYPLAGTPESVDALVNRAITSQTGVSATNSLNQLLARSAVLAPQKPASAPLPPIIASSISSAAPISSSSLPAGTPDEVKRLFQQARQYLGVAEEIELGACIALTIGAILTDGVTASLATTCLKKLFLQKAFEAAQQVIGNIITYIESFYRQPARPLNPLTPLTPLASQPGGVPGSPAALIRPQPGTPGEPPSPAPLVLHQPCETCMTPTQRAKYRAQRDELKREIEIETQQDTDQQLDQIQSELDALKSLEGQPSSGRNIQQELEHKRALERQLDQLQQQRGEPTEQPGDVPVVKEPLEQIPIKQRQPDAAEAITFCVGCQSNEDAILFLNGEPSACSVIPGSTKPLIPQGDMHDG